MFIFLGGVKSEPGSLRPDFRLLRPGRSQNGNRLSLSAGQILLSIMTVLWAKRKMFFRPESQSSFTSFLKRAGEFFNSLMKAADDDRGFNILVQDYGRIQAGAIKVGIGFLVDPKGPAFY